MTLAAAAAAALLCSCSKEETTLTQIHPLMTDEIVFSAGGLEAEVQTKATSAVTSLSTFNVNCVTGTMGSAETSIFNAAFSGTTSFTGGKYWPATDAGYKFYASNMTLTPSASGPTIAATNATDAVCAVLKAPTFKASNTLAFEHVFARIGSCKITAPADGATVKSVSVSITPKTGGTYSLFAGSGKTDGTGWSSVSTGSATTLTSKTGDTADNGLYLVPGSYTLTAKYTLTRDGYEESFTKTATVNIVAGKVNNISATLPNSNAKQITFTVSVAEWGTNNITANLS